MRETIRCAGCGKPGEDGVLAVRIALGKTSGAKFGVTKEWGKLHRKCFEGAIDSPSATMAEVRRQAKK